MTLFAAFLSALFGIAAWLGLKRKFRLEHLSKKRIVNGLIVFMIALTGMSIAHFLGYLPQTAASRLTMFLYTVAAGYFLGYGSKLIELKKQADNIRYVYRSFWSDLLPNLIAITLVAIGIYRTGLLTLEWQSGIAVTSGLSLIGFGFWGWTVRVVPEFREKGILVLDQCIFWKKVVSYSWISENILNIIYLNADDKLTDFSTFIPPEDHLTIERTMGKKMEDCKEQREEYLSDIQKQEN